jgi:hypothetical protein
MVSYRISKPFNMCFFIERTFRQELESLQTQVNNEREKYQQNAMTSSVSAIPALCINDLFTLSQVSLRTLKKLGPAE